METLSSAAKNRWEECGAMATKLVEAVEEYYSTPAVPQNQTAGKRIWSRVEDFRGEVDG